MKTVSQGEGVSSRLRRAHFVPFDEGSLARIRAQAPQQYSCHCVNINTQSIVAPVLCLCGCSCCVVGFKRFRSAPQTPPNAPCSPYSSHPISPPPPPTGFSSIMQKQLFQCKSQQITSRIVSQKNDRVNPQLVIAVDQVQTSKKNATRDSKCMMLPFVS